MAYYLEGGYGRNGWKPFSQVQWEPGETKIPGSRAFQDFATAGFSDSGWATLVAGRRYLNPQRQAKRVSWL